MTAHSRLGSVRGRGRWASVGHLAVFTSSENVTRKTVLGEGCQVVSCIPKELKVTQRDVGFLHHKTKTGKGQISNAECQKMATFAQPSFVRKMFPVLLRVAVPILSPFILLQNSLALLFSPPQECVCVSERERMEVFICV